MWAAPHWGHPSMVVKWPGLSGLVAAKIFLVATAFARRLRLGHPLRHLGLRCAKVETRAALHGRMVKEWLEFFAHHLLDKNETPELKLEPIEVLLCTRSLPTVIPDGPEFQLSCARIRLLVTLNYQSLGFLTQQFDRQSAVPRHGISQFFFRQSIG